MALDLLEAPQETNYNRPLLPGLAADQPVRHRDRQRHAGPCGGSHRPAARRRCGHAGQFRKRRLRKHRLPQSCIPRGVATVRPWCSPTASACAMAGKVLGQPVRDNVNGTDLFPLSAAALQNTDKRIFLLGGRPGVAAGVARWLAKNYPGVEVAGFRHGYYSPDEEADVIEDIRRSGADLVLVAFGAPRQDLWIPPQPQPARCEGSYRRGRPVGLLLRPHSPRPALGPQAGRGMVLSPRARTQAALAAISGWKRCVPDATATHVAGGKGE